MLTDRNEQPKPQTSRKHPDKWQSDLNPNHMAGQNIVPPIPSGRIPRSTSGSAASSYEVSMTKS